MFRNRFPLICFHICSSDLFTVSPVSLHVNFELQQHHNQKKACFSTKFHNAAIMKELLQTKSQFSRNHLYHYIQHYNQSFIIKVWSNNVTPFSTNYKSISLTPQFNPNDPVKPHLNSTLPFIFHKFKQTVKKQSLYPHIQT